MRTNFKNHYYNVQIIKASSFDHSLKQLTVTIAYADIETRRFRNTLTKLKEAALLFAGAIKIIFGLAICSLPLKMGLTLLSGILCMFGLIVILVGLGGVFDGIHELKGMTSSFLHRPKHPRQPEPGS